MFHFRMSFPKWLLPDSVPRASPLCLFRRRSRISEWIRTRVLSNCFLCTGAWSTWHFVCVFKNGVSVSWSPEAVPNISPTGFQRQLLWGVIFWCISARLRSLRWHLGPCPLRNCSATVLLLPFVVCWLGVVAPDVSPLCPAYSPCWGSFFMCLVVEILLAVENLQAVLVDSCCVLVAQSRLTLCDPMDGSPPGPSVHRILQTRTLERVAMPSSRDLPDPGIDPGSPVLPVDSLTSETPRER